MEDETDKQKDSKKRGRSKGSKDKESKTESDGVVSTKGLVRGWL